MVRKLLLLSSLVLVALGSYSQTLYVPSGTSGIGSSFNGNVGIGISTPLEKLHLSGAIRGSSTGGALRINTANGYIDVGPQSTSAAHIYTDRNYFLFNKPIYSANGQFCAVPTYPLQFQTLNTTRMTITTGGLVGVGCVPTYENLRIYQAEKPTIVLANSISKLEIGVASAGYDFAPKSKPGDVVFRPLGHADNHHGMIFMMPNTDNDGNSYIKFGDNANELWMGIFNNKTVRIDGTIYAKEINVKTNVWADDVLSMDYNLMPLTEVEQYINEKRKLPDVPSESEVKESGINVAMLDALLLRKIEEMTLYLIQLNKRIESMEQENAELKNKIPQ